MEAFTFKEFENFI